MAPLDVRQVSRQSSLVAISLVHLHGAIQVTQLPQADIALAVDVPVKDEPSENVFGARDLLDLKRLYTVAVGPQEVREPELV